MSAHATYRPDIDGLRAVAVLSVLIYHAFPDWLPGGFIGVDVFFVISGYLISNVLFQNPTHQVSQLLDFYVRRVRRLYPALTVVLFSVWVLGWFTLLAEELAMVGKHMAGGAAFVANWVFWSESGYFDQASTLKPLLHLWSLGIEEQFYLVWPLALMVAMRFRWPLGTFTLVLLFASLGWNLWSHESRPVDAFYLPWARCWELLAGAWLAYALGQGQVQLSPQSQRFMAPVGLGLLVSAWWLIHQDAAFPGWWALMPVVGTALIIASGPLSWVNRKLLAHRWMVGIGLISYPLYLWHWPLISWLHITEGQTPPTAWLVAALGLSFVLAYATWRWVERPLRFGANAKRVALLLLSAVAAIGAIGWYVYMMDGVKERVAAKVTLVYSGDHGHHSFFDWMEKNTVPCTPMSLYESADVWEGHVRCRQSRPGPVDVALIGDSHAEHLFPGLVQQFPEVNIAYYFKIGPAFWGDKRFSDIYRHVIENASIKHVVLTMFWERRLKAIRPESSLSKELMNTIEQLSQHGKKITITNGVPHFNFNPNLCRTQRVKLIGQSSSCEAKVPTSNEITTAFDSIKDSKINLVDTKSFFCKANMSCSMILKDEILFRDDNHLNLIGSEKIIKHTREQHGQWLN